LAFIFNGSIRDNIALGKPGTTTEEVTEAALSRSLALLSVARNTTT
jgi:ABC-type multidrug transport system fused ATPase/permease subunit